MILNNIEKIITEVEKYTKAQKEKLDDSNFRTGAVLGGMYSALSRNSLNLDANAPYGLYAANAAVNAGLGATLGGIALREFASYARDNPKDPFSYRKVLDITKKQAPVLALGGASLGFKDNLSDFDSKHALIGGVVAPVAGLLGNSIITTVGKAANAISKMRKTKK